MKVTCNMKEECIIDCDHKEPHSENGACSEVMKCAMSGYNCKCIPFSDGDVWKFKGERKVVNYTIISGNTSELEKLVMYYINEGWKLQGGASALNTPKLFCQAVVKYG